MSGCRTTMAKHVLGGLLAAAVLCSAAAAAGPDPDWPCQQPLVRTETAAMVWTGPSVANIGDWRANPSVAALVQRIAPRSVSIQDGEAAIQDFLKKLHGDRKHLVTLAFAGLLDSANDQRGEVIDRIKDLAVRQRHLSDIVNHLGLEVGKLPPTEQTNPSPPNQDLVQRWTFTTQAYRELQQTMQYACQIPGEIDTRLGAYARTLAAGLS